MASEWYYAVDGLQHGPVSSHELRERARAGKFAPTDLIWKEGMPEWRPARCLKGLFPASSPPPLPVQQNPISDSEPPPTFEQPIPTEGSAYRKERYAPLEFEPLMDRMTGLVEHYETEDDPYLFREIRFLIQECDRHQDLHRRNREACEKRRSLGDVREEPQFHERVRELEIESRRIAGLVELKARLEVTIVPLIRMRRWKSDKQSKVESSFQNWYARAFKDVTTLPEPLGLGLQGFL